MVFGVNSREVCNPINLQQEMAYIEFMVLNNVMSTFIRLENELNSLSPIWENKVVNLKVIIILGF